MLFNSIQFLIYLPIVFVVYWQLSKGALKFQNAFLLLASYFFYGLWDWRFLGLILFSTFLDFVCGQKIFDNLFQKQKARFWLSLSLFGNLGVLAFFKYYNFFADSLLTVFENFGYTAGSTWTLQIILPVGISFYTFQTLSYSFDIYYERVKPTNSPLTFATYVAFFPQLVAGPIERASSLLKQMAVKRRFDYTQTVDGLKLILWGFFKKLVIADALAPIVDDIFANYTTYSGSTLILGVILFSFQIYGDFSGYSDIAIGTSKLFGIELKSNFKFPIFSRNVAEYWQRWHISLSTWFRHYLYIPLGGSRQGKFKSIRNICIVFLVSGLWHGANWTFVVWGAFHAVLFIPVFLMGRNRMYMDNSIAQNSWFPSIKEIFQVLLTFGLITFSRIFFRSPTLTDAWAYIEGVCYNFYWEPYLHPRGYRMIDYYVLIIIFVLFEYRIRKNERKPFDFKSPFIRFALYSIVIFTILLFFDDGVNRSFIYFQF